MAAGAQGNRGQSEERCPRRLHRCEPDYGRPLLQIPPEKKQALLEMLGLLYGANRAADLYPELERILRVYYAHKPPEMIEEERSFDPAERFSERDVILITYGDSVDSPGKKPLQALADILDVLCRQLINTVHVLPFFPYSSDRGFAITDFEEVDPRLGTWEDIKRLSLDFRLMFDGVINHASSRSRWFQEFLNGNPDYQDFFTSFSTRDALSDDQLHLILRPRTTPLLTCFQGLTGPRYVWTTFGPDQVDLNYKNPRVLLRILEILLYYVRHGADLIRLDAVTYLWEEVGTTGAHFQQTHTVVQLLRLVLNVVAPRVGLLTETNVPHQDNISYFGDGRNEAQMVYTFALPPLVLLAFLTGNCSRLAEWAAGLAPVSDCATYFNFLDSHDGVGLLPVRGIATPDEIDFLTRKAVEHGGLVSYRTNEEGEPSPYELNITWFNALNGEGSSESLDLQVDRFVASRSIALTLLGVPGIYLPSLVGGRNDQEGVRTSGEARSINHGVLNEHRLFEQLGDESSAFYRIADRYFRLLEQRIRLRAFHPNGRQRVIGLSDRVFCVLREARDTAERVLALANVTATAQTARIPLDEVGGDTSRWYDVLSEQRVEAREDALTIHLQPYQVLWLIPER